MTNSTGTGTVQGAWKGRWQRGNQVFHAGRRKEEATREHFVHCFLRSRNLGTSHPIKQVQKRFFHIKHHCEMSHQGCGGAQRTHTQRTLGQIQGQKLHARLQKHKMQLWAREWLPGSRKGTAQPMHSRAAAQRSPGAPLAAAQGGAPCLCPHVPSLQQCHGWGSHTVPMGARPRAAKPTFPLTFSMLAHCIRMVFIEVSAKAIQTLPKSRLGKNTAAWPKLYIFPALSEGLKS